MKGTGQPIKIAIVSHSRISDVHDGKMRLMKDMAELISDEDMRVEVFSLSDVNRTVKEKHYIEHEIKSPYYTSSSTAKRLFDNGMMILFGTRPLLNEVNRSESVNSMLSEFGPDIIICETFLLNGMLKRYLEQSRKKVKVISTFDSQSRIYYYANALFGPGSGGGYAPLFRQFKRSLAGRYVKFRLKLYKETLNLADLHVVLSKKDKEEIESFFKMRKARIVVLPAHFFDSKRERKPSPKASIRKILFIGSYLPPHNRQAMGYIEDIISPMLPEKEFIIAGGGVPKKVVRNVKYIGGVEDMGSILDDADLCIAPLTDGIGLKVKMLDYFNAGKAVIGTSMAFEGYDVKNEYNAIVEDNIEHYASQIEKLEKDRELFARIQKNSKLIVNDYRYDVLKKKWQKLIKELHCA